MQDGLSWIFRMRLKTVASSTRFWPVWCRVREHSDMQILSIQHQYSHLLRFSYCFSLLARGFSRRWTLYVIFSPKCSGSSYQIYYASYVSFRYSHILFWNFSVRKLLNMQINSMPLHFKRSRILNFVVDVDGWPRSTYNFLLLGLYKTLFSSSVMNLRELIKR